MIRLELDNNRRFAIVAVAIVVFVFFFVLFLPKKQIYRGHMGVDSITYSYEMPRGQSAEVPFDLSNRDLIQRYNQNPAANPQTAVTTAPVPAVKAAQDKAKKAAEAKKKAAKKDDKKDPKAQGKRNKMKVDVTNTSRSHWTADSTPDSPEMPMAAVPGYWGAQAAAQAPGATTDPNAQDDNIDVSTWLSMLQNHPSADIIQKFLKARNSGQIGDADFYRIVSALLQDGASDRQKAGVSILSADVSPSTYEFLVVKTGSFSADVQGQLKPLLNTYATPAKFLVLGRVLASSQTKAVLQSALGQLAQVVSTSKTPAPSTTGGTTGVSGQSAGVSAAQLMSFTSVLQRLAKNSDSSIASQAQSILTQIQALTKTTT